MNRRFFLTRLLGATAAGLVMPGLLAACGNDKPAEPASISSAPKAACAESAELALAVKATRKALAYEDQAPQPEKVCSNCRYFKAATPAIACGGCEIVGGPIAPGGYCNAWVAPS